MSISFGNLDLSNGLASRLLRAVGYSVEESNDGGMNIDQMLTGIQNATVSTDDSQYLQWLKEEVLKAQEAGETVFRWS